MVNHSYLSDLNADLVVAYNIIKTEPEKLINILKKHFFDKNRYNVGSAIYHNNADMKYGFNMIKILKDEK